MNVKDKDVLKVYNNYCIIGMSPDHDRYSYKIYHRLKDLNKNVYGVSPKYKEIENEKMYSSLLEIDHPIDVVVFVVNKTIGMSYIKEMRELGIKYAWMQPHTYDEDLLNAFHDQGIETIENCVLKVLES